jgi:tetratricopeptide (TPR) repeat protein
MRKAPLLFFLCLGALAFAQKVTTKVSVYNEIFLTDSGFAPLPDNAVELECVKTIKSELFDSPLKLARDPKGNIYVTSKDGNAIFRYSFDGKPLGQLGMGARGRNLFKSPEEVEVGADRIAVYERPANRITFLSFEGAKLESWKVPEIEDFALDKEGHPVVAPIVETRESPLVLCFSREGRFRGFGKPLAFAHSMPSLNARSIAVSGDGDIYVAFQYFPIVRRYSAAGALLGEYRIETPTMQAKERYNLKAIGEGMTDLSRRSQYKPLIVEIESLGNAVFLVSHNPRLEITELDDHGAAKATYWMDSREIYFASDLAVLELGGEKIFWVAHSSPPEYSVDILRTKPKAPTALDADIQKWTDEIRLYPENSLAYVNRGMARHLTGDFREAIADFSKAIELDPNSSVAYNDRGLSKVKSKDFDGAVRDFSAALGLDPKAAAVYFNRGIARIHNNDLREAIEDFEAAARIDGAFAARAKEQIEYCRARLDKSQETGAVASPGRP